MNRFLLFTCAAATGCAAAAATAPVAGDSVLATVNGVPVTRSDISSEVRAEEIKLRNRTGISKDNLEQEYYNIRLEALENRIDRLLLLQEYERNPFDIPPRYIESALDEAAENAGCRNRMEFVARLRDEGIELDELRKNIREDMIAHAVLSDKLRNCRNITPSDVAEYYKTHQEEFRRTGHIALAVVKLPPDETDGFSPDFTAVAAVSVETDRLRSEFLMAAADLPAGTIIGPVAADGDRFMLKIVSREEGGIRPLKSVSSVIRSKLENQADNVAKKEISAELRADAVIRYHVDLGKNQTECTEEKFDRNEK